MGLAVSSLRLMYLTMYRTDLEYKLQLITQTKMGLSNSVNDLLNVGTDLDPTSPEYKMLETRKEKLQLVDKKLEAQMTRYKSQLSMIEADLESIQKKVDANIKRAFSY